MQRVMVAAETTETEWLPVAIGTAVYWKHD